LKLPSSSRTPTAWDLLWISAVGLYFEVLFIRWIGSEVPLIAFFKNMVLISCFLGFGLGYGLTRLRWNLMRAFIPYVLLFSFIIMQGQGLNPEGFVGLGNEEVTLGGQSNKMKYLALAVAFYLLNLFPFVAAGQMTGRAMEGFRPLAAYSINIAGSILGIVAFSVISHFALPPVVWFTIGLVPALWLLRRELPWLVLSLICAAVCTGLVWRHTSPRIWSPYYRIDLQVERAPDENGEDVVQFLRLRANGIWFLGAFNRSESMRRLYPEFYERNSIYADFLRFDLPCLVSDPDDVIVVGCGLGNDTWAALQHGADSVHGIDIDPMIVDIGRRLHPQRPYDDPRVKITINDGRAFFRQTDEQADLILYGVLEARTLFSSLSNVRLDNFIYTVEGLADAASHLSDDGVLWINMYIARPWMATKLISALTEVFGRPPVILQQGVSHNDHGHMSFAAGPNLTREDIEPLLAQAPEGHPVRLVELAEFTDDESRQVTVTPTDDWPYFFYRTRRLGREYQTFLGLMALISVPLIWLAYGRPRRIDMHFTLLGTAFLLLETRAVVQLALLAGTTWYVNSLAFISILLMILVANWITERHPIEGYKLPYTLLVISMICLYLFPMRVLLPLPFAVSTLLGAMILAVPLFFAALVFANSFRRTKNIPQALGSNLLGAVLGGFLEYTSMLFGLKNLVLLALLLYLLSAVALKRRAPGVV
jgi:spermidine synthase